MAGQTDEQMEAHVIRVQVAFKQLVAAIGAATRVDAVVPPDTGITKAALDDVSALSHAALLAAYEQIFTRRPAGPLDDAVMGAIKDWVVDA